jgi:hypothetical protein
MIKAIETKYKGYHFRSRTEARWAVFFDDMGYTWEYEREGFQLPSGYYLPDFYLTYSYHKIYIEVKGQEFTFEERQKCKELSVDYDVVMLDGQPKLRSYDFYSKGEEEVNSFIFIPAGEKYAPFYYVHDLNPDPEYYSSTLLSVHEALSYRF